MVHLYDHGHGWSASVRASGTPPRLLCMNDLLLLIVHPFFAKRLAVSRSSAGQAYTLHHFQMMSRQLVDDCHV